MLRLKDEAVLARERELGPCPEQPAVAPCAFSIGMAVRAGDEKLAATIARADVSMYAARASTRRQTEALA